MKFAVNFKDCKKVIRSHSKDLVAKEKLNLIFNISRNARCLIHFLSKLNCLCINKILNFSKNTSQKASFLWESNLIKKIFFVFLAYIVWKVLAALQWKNLIFNIFMNILCCNKIFPRPFSCLALSYIVCIYILCSHGNAYTLLSYSVH